jgi:hypothetical protein
LPVRECASNRLCRPPRRIRTESPGWNIGLKIRHSFARIRGRSVHWKKSYRLQSCALRTPVFRPKRSIPPSQPGAEKPRARRAIEYQSCRSREWPLREIRRLWRDGDLNS